MIRPLWHPETVYLNTASFGLPPDPAWEALQRAQSDWRYGRVSWEHWTAVTDRARAEFATLTRARTEDVVVGANVSGLIAHIAAGLPDGSRVLAPEPEFTSLLFPFLAQARRGVTVDVVPLDRLAEAVDARTDVVAVSAVQSSTGELADLDAITAAARHHGARVVVDATHAIGWLPVDASRFDALACAAYKWLMSPRGTAFMVLQPELAETLNPDQAGWYAAANPLTDQFGPPLRLADPAASTPRPRGSAGSGPSRRSSCSTRSGSRPCTRTTSRSPTASAAGSGSPRATPRSSPRRSRARRRSSRGRGSWPRPARAGCARRFTCTTPRPTWTRP